MGILRTDRITGLGGANAITGSTFFGGGVSAESGSASQNNLQLDISSDFNLGTNNFTIEAFIYLDALGQFNNILAVGTDSTNGYRMDLGTGNNLRLVTKLGSDSWGVLITGSTTFIKDKWYHVAVTRSGNSFDLWVDGTKDATTVTNSGAVLDATVSSANSGTNNIGVEIGSLTTYGFSRKFNGYISNLHLVNGTALYTSNYTIPTTRLEKRSDTVILTCNSAGNVLNEETGKTIIKHSANINSQGPVASSFTPNSPVGFSTTTDVGTQFGSTFDGVTTFDSQAYFVPPSGKTSERNRGRGLIFGGYSPNPAAHVSTIQSIEIQSFGNAQDFGDLSSIRSQMGAVSSSTRAVSCGGGSDTPSDYSDINTCEFVTIASTSNTTDFGDLSVSRQPYKGCSNDTRGIIFGGYIHPANSNTIDFITIATTGNATDFGDEIDTNRAGASCSSTTRGIVAGGYPATNRISFVEIATTGNAQDFGDLLNSVVAPSGCSNKTRGVFAGGSTPTAINVIQFITMSSAGDATDFGDLNTTEKVGSRGTSNSIRGLFSGGYDGGTFVNSISAITIATTGDAVDFGDISGTLRYAAGTSDSHGGLE